MRVFGNRFNPWPDFRSKWWHTAINLISSSRCVMANRSRGADSDYQLEPPVHEAPLMSKSKFEENEQLKEKVASLKWKMQHQRALKLAKRKGEKSPCGWLEALDVSIPQEPPKPRKQTGFCGLKRGFLLADWGCVCCCMHRPSDLFVYITQCTCTALQHCNICSSRV